MLSEQEIFDLAGNYDCGMREENEHWNFTSQRQMLTFVRAILAAHTAKLLAEVGMPEYKYIDRHDVPKEGMCVYTQDQLQQYAAAAAAQARMNAMDEAMLAVNSGVLRHGECAAAIESLKGKQA